MTTKSCIIRGVDRVESCTICSLSGRSAAEKQVKSTLFIGLTNITTYDKIKTN